MGKRIEKNGWLYEYETAPKYRETFDYELTDVRYILGETFNPQIKKVLICIGINPSTASPENLDQTLIRVQKYAKESGEYGAWYMLNVYPQRATDPNNMDIEVNMEIHECNIEAIKKLLTTVQEADVWCAWGATMADNKRQFLSDLFYGNDDKKTKSILSLFDNNYTFKAYGATAKGYPKHPLVMGKAERLKNIKDIPELRSLLEKIRTHFKTINYEN